MRTLLLIACLFVIHGACAQNPDSLRIKMLQMADKGGYGILFAKVGTTAVTAASSGFKGLCEIDLAGPRLDSICNSPMLRDETAQKSLMDLAQMLVKKGVEYRNNGENRDAILCYRLPLIMVCKRNEKAGMDIISRNLWTAKEEMKYQVTSALIKTTDGLLKADAEYLLKEHGAMLESESFTADASYETFLLYHRLADFAHDEDLRKKILLKKLDAPGGMEESRLLTAIMEELAEVTLIDLLVDDKKNAENFKKTWDAFLKYRNSVPERNVQFFRNLFNYSLQSFNLLEIAAVSAGGPFGHDLSYRLSHYIQEIGRDVVYFDMVNGKPLDALEVSENLRAKSLGGWLARNHRNRLFTFKQLWGLTNYTVSKPWLRAVTQDDIFDAAKNSGSPVLTYLQVRGQYIAWLITPAGKVFYGVCGNVDSLSALLYKRLPYNFQPKPQPAKGGKTGRGLAMEFEVKAGHQDPVLSKCYLELFPSNIRTEIANDNSGKLVIIPDGALNYIPFDALINEQGKYLVEEREIVFWPSVGSWMILDHAAAVFDHEKASPGKEGDTDIKIFGDPVFSGAYGTTVNGTHRLIPLAPLPGSGEEAKNIAKLFNTTPLLKEQAHISEFSGKMKYSILHLATHGYMNAEDPKKSFIALSGGPLYAEELYNEKFIVKCKLVVLSACQTGLGSLTSDSPIGLNSSFLIGGASCTVSSLWSVDDEATSELMQAFYRNIKDGSTVTKALRDAQLSMIAQQKWENPLFWAAFKATGISKNPLEKK